MAAGGWLCGSPEGSGGLGVSELGPAPRAEGAADVRGRCVGNGGLSGRKLSLWVKAAEIFLSEGYPHPHAE